MADFPKLRGAGNFEAEYFDPMGWKTNYPNPAFLLMESADAFWAAKQVAVFRDDEIRALVETGEYSDPRTTAYISATIAARRDKIVRAWFPGRLPLDRFEVDGGVLRFSPIGQPGPLRVSWAAFDPQTGRADPIPNLSGYEVRQAVKARPEARYLSATIQDGNGARVVVYVSAANGKVVGLDRT
jgi:hypothetical protein